MKSILILFSVFFISSIPLISAQVWIPEDEFHGYFDSSGIYTVVGAVRNRIDYPVLPTVKFVINEDGKMTSVSQQLPTVFPHNDIPFKLKFPSIANQNIVLENPSVDYDTVIRQPSNIQIIYDKTLVKHADGHLSGRIINQGNTTEHDVKVYATIHGKGNVLVDTGKNMEKVASIAPGQILNFTIYPDPLVASEVNYYSCFAIGDETIIPVYAIRNGDKFNFRYDSTAAFTVVGFDESGTSLTMRGINSFKVATFVNFEFPRTSDNEKFSVLVNDEPVKSIQSQDEEKNWHVAFNIDGATQSKIVISGFANSQAQPTTPSQEISKTTADKSDYSFVYYLLAALAAAIGIFVYKNRSKKLAG